MIKNEFFLHFFSKIFAYIKKKLYLCTRLKNKPNRMSYLTYSRLDIKSIITIKNSQL